VLVNKTKETALNQSNPKNYLASEKAYFDLIEDHFNESSGSYTEKTSAFARFVPRQAIGYFLVRNEIFKEIVSVHGSILDFGAYRGASFFTWLQLSAIYEPYNHTRKIVGFDSFEGFPKMGENDKGAEGHDLSMKRKGGMAFDGLQEIQKGLELFDSNRPLGHIKKGSIVKGVLPGVFESYLGDHQETIISLANIGLGLYEPVVELLKLIKPRLIKGSIIVFEDLNQATWPGETKALFEVFEPQDISLKRLPICPQISWMKIEA